MFGTPHPWFFISVPLFRGVGGPPGRDAEVHSPGGREGAGGVQAGAGRGAWGVLCSPGGHGWAGGAGGPTKFLASWLEH